MATSKCTNRGDTWKFIARTILSNTDECILWPYARNNMGYGQIRKDKVTRYVHRYICEFVHGPPQSAKHCVAHDCGKGHLGCINPRHLSWKSLADNQADRLKHGTECTGEKHGLSKLTTPQVLAIFADERHRQLIAAEYGINESTVRKIKKRQRWAHVTG